MRASLFPQTALRMTSHTFTRLLITLHLPDAALRKLEAIFPKIHYYPDAVDAPPPAEVLRDADVWFLRWTGALKGVKLEDTPNLRLIQLTYGMSHIWLVQIRDEKMVDG